MNRRNGINQSKRMLAVMALALCAVALAFPVATACAAGAELYVSQEGDDGYGTAWFVDPGEWYMAPAAPIARARKAPPADDGYGTAWFVDPGEWYVAPETPVVLVSKTEPDDDGYGITWFADPGEWRAAWDESSALAGQGGSSTP